MPRVDADEVVLDAEAEAHELREERSQRGLVGRGLEIQEARVQLRAAYTRLTDTLEKAHRVAEAEGWPAGRAFLRTHFQADVHLLGRSANFLVRYDAGGNQVGTGSATSVVVDFYIHQWLTSPFLVKRLLQGGTVGSEARAGLLDYIERNVYRPGLEALWSQSWGGDGIH